TVLGTHSEPLDLGRGHRLITLALRRALILRDRGCVFPNCERPARWCDGHHIVPWFHGGATDITNCALLCRTHHTLMHHDHCEWDIHMVNGHPEFLPPKYIDPERKPLRNTLHPTLE
ncbi:MAG: HNH endonuclease signature motif containing protein, partial [Sciscionella sp.]